MVFAVAHNLNAELFDSAMRTKKLHDFVAMPLHCSIKWCAALIIASIYLGPFGKQ